MFGGIDGTNALSKIQQTVFGSWRVEFLKVAPGQSLASM